MTLTAFVGALVALLPQVRPKPTPLDAEIARLTLENKSLARSHARLVDHIESLEREILTEQHLSAHWREEAQRLAKASREAREAREARHEYINGRNALAYAQAVQAVLAQQNAAAQQAQALCQGQLGMQAQLARFCNCVPSRSQVWAENSLVHRLNREGEI